MPQWFGYKRFISVGVVTASVALFSFLYLAPNLIRIADRPSELKECERFPEDPRDYERSERHICQSDAIRRMTRESGVAAAVTAFESYFKTAEGKPIEGPTCHVLAHLIGETAVDTGVSGGEILATCGEFCNGGCLNGAAHIYILSSGDIEDAEAFCNSADVGEKVRIACYHGIGHGITEFVQLDVAKGIAMCDLLEDEAGRYKCAHAVFMDFEPLFSAESARIPADMLSFCMSIDPLYGDTCYEYAGSLTYSRTHDEPAALELCARMPDGMRKNCTFHVMDVILHTTARPERPEKISSICGAQNAVTRRLCFTGASRAAIFTIGGSAGDESLAICEAAPEALHRDCYLEAAIWLSYQFGKDPMREFCTNVPPEHREACMSV